MGDVNETSDSVFFWLVCLDVGRETSGICPDQEGRDSLETNVRDVVK